MSQSRNLIHRIWTCFLSALLIVFMLLSMNSLLPLKWQFPSWKLSPHLTERTEKTAKSSRTDYVNADGDLTVALDMNFATVIKDLDQNGNWTFLQYFDNKGKPAVRALGHSALRREYNTEGKWINTIYLDTGLNPVKCRNGYAVVRLTYNDIGKIETEMFYDEDGLPTLDKNGKYGARYEYDENMRVSVVTNLDSAGKPMSNNNNIVSYRKTYAPDGRLYKEMFYDEDGHPAVLSYGQSGYMYENSKVYCINQNGRRMFVLRFFLYHSVFAVLMLGLILLALVMLSENAQTWFILFIYLVFIAYMTIMNREARTGAITWDIPPNYYLFFMDYEILENIWLFVPLGTILYKLSHMWEIVAVPVVLSMAIETTQLLFDLGYFEFSDLIANTLGGIVGVIICYLLESLLRKNRKS